MKHMDRTEAYYVLRHQYFYCQEHSPQLPLFNVPRHAEVMVRPFMTQAVEGWGGATAVARSVWEL
jgi:hypothetical protein